MLGNKIRHINRYRNIATVLARHGFGFFVEEMGLASLLSLPKRIISGHTEGIEELSVGQRLRSVLEELGPTFVKLGQVASTRSDLFTEDIVQELVKLQDQVPPFAFEKVEEIIEQELKLGVSELYSVFDPNPIAAASIGQVHAAVLKSGEKVAVKVQRPGISNIIKTDLEILINLAMMAERRLQWAKVYKLVDLAKEFADSLLAELDYTIEARNSERIAKNLESDLELKIPRVYWQSTTKKVLTMEYVEGIKLSQPERLAELGYSSRKIAEKLINIIFNQILIQGFFHADPHPGNVLVLPGQVISLLDFGMVGRLTPELKYHFATLVIAMMRQDTDSMIKAVIKMGLINDSVDLSRFYNDIDDLRLKYLDIKLSQIHLGEAVNDLFKVAFKHQIKIPAELTLLGKSLLTLEGLILKLDPDISIIDIAKPYGRQLLLERYKPKTIATKLLDNITDYTDIVLDIPKQVKGLLRNIQNGQIRLQIGIPELEFFLKKLDRISNQISFSIVLLSFSIVMSGLIIASAVGREPILFWKIPAIEAGFFVASFMFIWLLISIIKSGKF